MEGGLERARSCRPLNRGLPARPECVHASARRISKGCRRQGGGAGRGPLAVGAWIGEGAEAGVDSRLPAAPRVIRDAGEQAGQRARAVAAAGRLLLCAGPSAPSGAADLCREALAGDGALGHAGAAGVGAAPPGPGHPHEALAQPGRRVVQAVVYPVAACRVRLVSRRCGETTVMLKTRWV